MCRLALYGNLSEEFTPLARTLNQLERSLGGDGNGFYNPYIDNDPIKGLELTTGEIAYETLKAPGATLFHTRYATAGDIAGYLNHPFIAGDWILAHNGHWHEWRDYADLYGTESDTETASELVASYGPGVLTTPEFASSGIWILTRPDETLVIHRSGSFIFQWLKTGGYCHASEKLAHYAVARTMRAKRNHAYRIDNMGQVSKTRIPGVTLPMPAPKKPKKLTALSDEFEPSDYELALWEDALNRWYSPEDDTEGDSWLDDIPATDWDSKW